MEYSQIVTLSSNQGFLRPVRIATLDHGIIYPQQGTETQEVGAVKTSVSGWPNGKSPFLGLTT